MEKLKPCPFCGGEAVVKQTSYHYSQSSWGDIWRVYCSGCRVEQTKEYRTIVHRNNNREIVIENDGLLEAIKDWNGRKEK